MEKTREGLPCKREKERDLDVVVNPAHWGRGARDSEDYMRVGQGHGKNRVKWDGGHGREDN